MNPIFEIQTIQTKDNLRYAAARIMRTKLIIHAVIMVVVALAFAIYVASKQIASAYFFSTVFGMACVGLAIYRFDSVPRKYAERTYSDMLLIHREPVISRICINADWICVENGQMHTLRQYGLTEITGMLENSVLFLLKTQKGSYIIIDKAGFINGDINSFRDFFGHRIKNTK